MTKSCCVWLLGFAMAMPMQGRDLISISIPPYTAAPATVELLISIIPHADNRGFSLSIEGENYYTSTVRELNGADAQRQWVFRYPHLAEGEYEVVVRVATGAGKILGQATKVFHVV